MSKVRVALVGVVLSLLVCGAAASPATASWPQIPIVDFCAITQADRTNSNPAIDNGGDGAGAGGYGYESKTNGCLAFVGDFKIGPPGVVGTSWLDIGAAGDDQASGFGLILDSSNCAFLEFGVHIYRYYGSLGGGFKSLRSGVFEMKWDSATSLCSPTFVGGSTSNWRYAVGGPEVDCKAPAASSFAPDTIRIVVWGKFDFPLWPFYPSISERVGKGQTFQPGTWNTIPTC